MKSLLKYYIDMKISRLFLLFIPSLLICGCKNEEPPKQVEPEQQEGAIEPPQAEEDLTPDKTVQYEIYDTMGVVEDKTCYTVETNYTDKYFKYTATTYKKDLMKLSFACSMSMHSKELGSKFFEDIGFQHVFTSETYQTGPTEHSVHYMIYKKNIDDFTIYAVGVKGTQYFAEWTDNLTLGENGNHTGFDQSANQIYEKLEEVLSNQTNIKLWLSGYSRGGAICNVLSAKIMKNPGFSLTKHTLYTYTFATPRGLAIENAVRYENVFNLVNSADIVTNFAPEEFGLFRCGIDINLYSENIAQYLNEFSEEIIMPTFTPVTGSYKTDNDYTRFLLKKILENGNDEVNEDIKPTDLNSRIHYYALQDDLCYLVGKLLSIDRIGTVFEEKFKYKSRSELLALIKDPVQSCQALKEIFTEQEVDYEEDKLQTACNSLTAVATHYSYSIVITLANENYLRMINMHMAETTYVTINHLQ